MKNTNCTACIILSIIMVTLLGEGQGQNYHFSNGWQPGKRSQEICQFRPDVKNLIFKLIEVSDKLNHNPFITLNCWDPKNRVS